MSYGRIHTTTQRSLPTNRHLTPSSQQIPGRSPTQTPPAPMSPTASTQRCRYICLLRFLAYCSPLPPRRSAIPTRVSWNTNAQPYRG